MRASDIAEGLRRLGLGAGDHALVHSSLSSFGVVDGGAETVIDAILSVIGETGTLMVPTFGSADEVFDPASSETTLGAIPAALRKRRGALRSRHPLASVAAIGSRAAWLTEGHEEAETAHGEGTPYHKLSQIGGKVLLLGVDQDRSTFLHTAEEVAGLPYLRPGTGRFLNAQGQVETRTWPLFPGPHRAFIGIQAWLEAQGLTRKTAIGSCVAQLMGCRELLDALLGRLRSEPDLFLTPNPNLADGIRQRADVVRAELERECFTTAADSAGSGASLEDLIRVLRPAGIRRVVLSTVAGTPWDLIEEPWRRWYLEGLRLAGLTAAAIRPARLDPARAAALAREAGTDLLIVPATAPAAAVEQAAAAGLRVLVQNVGLPGAEATRLIGSRGFEGCGIAFDPPAFVAMGENPFLTSFTKTRIRLRVGLLYACDGLAGGERTPLGSGHAEIAELVSMLRASRYAGLIVLRGAAGAPLEEEIARFRRMLHDLGSPV